jgi:hypothetical protein
MAVSRPVLLALVGAVLLGAVYFATMGARESSGGSAPAATPVAEKPPAKPAAGRSKLVTPDAKAKAAAKAKAGAAKAKATAPKTSAAHTSTAAKSPPAKPKVAPKKAAVPKGVPADVTRALEANRTVVLFFYQRGSADDDATAAAVNSVRGRANVKVFSAPITRLAAFRGVTGGAGVSQAPAVVILGRGGSARLIEGYVDSQTLAQEVADAR